MYPDGCECTYEQCIAAGVGCECACHSDFERVYMRQAIENRTEERCANCRWGPLTCAQGVCNCECHGDRPSGKQPVPIVAPGHDEFGHERGYPTIWGFKPVQIDFERLAALRDAYAGTHPEWTIGGA